MRKLRPAPHPLLVPLLVLGLAACDRGPDAGRDGGAEDARDSASEQDTEDDDDAPERDAAVPESAGVVLSREGLGVVRFGDEAEAALEKLRAAMGDPNTLTKWLPMERSLWGACAGSEVRGAKWGDLWVLFSDRSELGEAHHLSGWILGGNSSFGRTELRTTEGIGLGDRLTDLRGAYGDRLALEPFELGARFTVAPAPGEKAGSRLLAGTVSGEEDDDRVRNLRGGLPCTT